MVPFRKGIFENIVENIIRKEENAAKFSNRFREKYNVLQMFYMSANTFNLDPASSLVVWQRCHQRIILLRMFALFHKLIPTFLFSHITAHCHLDLVC